MKLHSAKEYCLFIEAYLLLGISKLMILVFPFKFIASKIGLPQTETSFINDFECKILETQMAVNRGAKYIFFQSKCYDQALASTFMLRRRGISSTIYFGLCKENGQLLAHAWVRAGQIIVSGKRGYENFTPIAWFGTHPK